MRLGVPLGGTVLFLPVRQQRARTIYRHPTWLDRLEKYCTLGGCCGLEITRQLPRDFADFIVANATLGGCVTVIGNELDLGNGVSGGSLYNVTDGHSAMTLTLMALLALYLGLRPDINTAFPNNKWQIYTREFSVNCN